MILREGRNRQIRRVAEQLGYPVIQLHRTKIGPINLTNLHGDELPMGQYRSLTPAELDELQRIISNKTYLSKNKESRL